MQKLSNIDRVLNKAKAVVQTSQEEELKVTVEKKPKKNESDTLVVDLHRVYLADSENPTKSPAITKLKSVKRTCWQQLKELETTE